MNYLLRGAYIIESFISIVKFFTIPLVETLAYVNKFK